MIRPRSDPGPFLFLERLDRSAFEASGWGLTYQVTFEGAWTAKTANAHELSKVTIGPLTTFVPNAANGSSKPKPPFMYPCSEKGAAP